MKIPFLKYYKIQKKYLVPYRKWIFLLAVLLISSIGLQLINPQIIRFYIDSFQITDISDESLIQRLFEAAILYIGIALFQQTLAVTSVYISQNLAWNSTNKLREDFTEHCINLDMTFHNEHSPGEFIERIDGDVTNLSNFFSQLTIMILSNLVLIGGILGVLFIEDWILGFGFALFTGVTLITLYLIWNLAMPYWKIARQKSAELFGQIEEHLTGKEDLCALGASAYTMKRFHSYSKGEYDSSYKAFVVSRGIHVTVMGMIALGSTLVFVVAIPLFNANVITVGTIFMVNSYVALLFRPIIQIVRETQNLTVADASIERLAEFFKIENKIIDSPMPVDSRSIDKALIHFKGPLTLEFDKLSFSYLEGEQVLRNVSFTLEPGKILGLIGRTGSGKTTISRLIFRLYNPTGGCIRINGLDHFRIPLKELREKIAYVTQQVELFNATIRDNITLFDDSYSDELIKHCIREIGLEEWFSRLPNGLNTKLDTSGFSAGEAQLLSITRVLLKNPSLVILDEASSRLDPFTEKLIEKAIDGLLKNRTALIIAHRLKTLDRVDEICHLENGKVVEYGNREKLLNNPKSQFAQLIKKGTIEEVLA